MRRARTACAIHAHSSESLTEHVAAIPRDDSANRHDNSSGRTAGRAKIEQRRAHFAFDVMVSAAGNIDVVSANTRARASSSRLHENVFRH